LKFPKLSSSSRAFTETSVGFFSETFNARALVASGIKDDFVQDNHSLSVQRGVVRGLHFQVPPNAQGKLIRVVRGSIFDVAVDIRSGSPTYGKHVSALLSAASWNQLWVPKGFAHGFCTLEPDTEVLYKVTDYFAPECDRGLRWDDSDIDIPWPIAGVDVVLSAKDKLHPALKDLPDYFQF